ncbi:MAG TPA: helix-turn-helix transcriptional regulator [Solirubrobacterales bacterium]|nr:helix-turn-helix transcriptional regulator [Solirubrobacterales bacterium]
MTAARKEATEETVEAAEGTDPRRLVFEQERLFSDTIETLAGLAKEQGISQRELARRVGRNQAQISRLLGGADNANLKTLARIAWALGIRLVIVGVPFGSRDGTPAAADPPLPEWLDAQRERRVGESPATMP